MKEPVCVFLDERGFLMKEITQPSELACVSLIEKISGVCSKHRQAIEAESDSGLRFGASHIPLASTNSRGQYVCSAETQIPMVSRQKKNIWRQNTANEFWWVMVGL